MEAFRDSWAEGPMVIGMKNSAQDDMVLLGAVATLAETGTVRYPESAGVHYFLANLYLDLPEELTLETRVQIEREKLRVTGQEHLFDMPADPKAYRTTDGPDIWAAVNYLIRTEAHFYAGFDNQTRAVSNLNEAIEKSRKNPELYEEVKTNTSLRFYLEGENNPVLRGRLWTTSLALGYG